MADIDEIKKLSPEERIKRLKKLEEEKRKEIEEAKKLLKESVVQFEEEEKIKEKIPIPQVTAVDIGALFTKEEQQLFTTKRYEEPKPEPGKAEEKQEPQEKTLEDEIWEAPKLTPEQEAEQRQYGEKLAMEQPSQLYTIAREVYDEFKETGVVDQEKLYALDIAAAAKDHTSPAGEYKAPSEEAQEQFGSVKSIVKYLRGK